MSISDRQYYQFGGFRPHITWHAPGNAWTSHKEIARYIAGPDSPLRQRNSDTVEIIYGIKPSGSVHLLLDGQAALEFSRARLASYRRGERRDEFLSLSPWIVNQADLEAKLRTLAPKGKSVKDTSQDNKSYSNLGDTIQINSHDMSIVGPGPGRAMYEHSRLLWLAQNDPRYASNYVPHISRICSVMLNTSGLDTRPTKERLNKPRIVDIATSEADPKTWVASPTATTYKACLAQKGQSVTENRVSQPRVKEATMCSDDEIHTHLREFFARPTSAATVLLVHDRVGLDTCAFLKEAGVDTRGWRNGVSRRLLPSPGSLHLWDQEQQDSQYDNRRDDHRRRSRSRSPARRGESSSYSSNRRRYRSRTPPPAVRDSPVYVISIQGLMSRVSTLYDRWLTLGIAGEKLGVTGCKADEWCAANEAEAAFEIYKKFASGPPIDIMSKQLSKAEEEKKNASHQAASGSKAPTVDVDADDFDPNDLPVTNTSTASVMNMDEESNYEEDDDDNSD